MILRRITEHVKAQNWFAVGLDFLIVVVGVFVGLQVSNWNEARNAAVAEAQLIVRLAEELEVLEVELAQDSERYASAVLGTRTVLTALRAGAAPADDEEFRRSLWRANNYPEIPSLSATYSELLASGGLARISNRDLRAALIRYGDAFERYERLYSVAYGVVFDPDSHYLSAVEWIDDPAGWRNPETAIVSYDWNALLGAKAELQAWLAHQAAGERNSRKMHQEIQIILALLESEMAS